jgi:uncharacterized membrane-anchored protein
VPFAIALIVIIEFARFGIGFYLGKNALPVFAANSLNIVALLVGVSIFFAQNYFKRKAATATPKTAFGINATGSLLIFTASFLLSVLVGNQWSRFENPTVNANISATLVEERPAKVNVDSLLSLVEKEQFVKEIQEPEPDKKTKDGDGLQRLGYFALFVLSVILTFIGVYAVCALACSGYGVIAVLAILVNIGILGGGVYFLLKVFKNGRIRRLRDMDKSERKKEWKRYLKATLITVGVLAGFLLIANLLG